MPTVNVGSTVVKQIELHCPQILTCQLTASVDELVKRSADAPPDLVLIDAEVFLEAKNNLPALLLDKGIPTILISNSPALAVRAVKYDLCGYLLLPLDAFTLIEAVNTAADRFAKKLKPLSYVPPATALERCQRIGIPTIDGFNFFSPHEIIRCEGYQNCTRIVTVKQSDIVSSYNIGVFRKKLEQFHFFSPHKSHLINLEHMSKFHKEGTITMSDNSSVPISKRKKSNFLKLVTPGR